MPLASGRSLSRQLPRHDESGFGVWSLFLNSCQLFAIFPLLIFEGVPESLASKRASLPRSSLPLIIRAIE